MNAAYTAKLAFRVLPVNVFDFGKRSQTIKKDDADYDAILSK